MIHSVTQLLQTTYLHHHHWSRFVSVSIAACTCRALMPILVRWSILTCIGQFRVRWSLPPSFAVKIYLCTKSSLAESQEKCWLFSKTLRKAQTMVSIANRLVWFAWDIFKQSCLHRLIRLVIDLSLWFIRLDLQCHLSSHCSDGSSHWSNERLFSSFATSIATWCNGKTTRCRSPDVHETVWILCMIVL